MKKATLALMLALFMGSTVLAKKKSEIDVTAILNHVIAAAQSDFSSIKDDKYARSLAPGQWNTTTVIPGARKCSLIHEDAKPGFYQREYFWYSCEMSRATTDPNFLAKTYGAWVSTVGQATGWSSALQKTLIPGYRRLQFTDRDRPLGTSVAVSLNPTSAYGGNGWAVEIDVFPPNIIKLPQSTMATQSPQDSERTRTERINREVSAPQVLPPVAPSSDSTIRGEIEKVRGGEYTPLPPIQATSSGPWRNGMAVFEVKNDTAYALTALFSGPLERRVEVAPGTSTSVELLPGAYKLVGRVNAPDVLPSYGEHTFDQGTSGLRFFLQ